MRLCHRCLPVVFLVVMAALPSACGSGDERASGTPGGLVPSDGGPTGTGGGPVGGTSPGGAGNTGTGGTASGGGTGGIVSTGGTGGMVTTGGISGVSGAGGTGALTGGGGDGVPTDAGGDGSLTDGGDGGVTGALCEPIPACDAPPPDSSSLGWNHLSSSITASSGAPNHRGRDLFVNPGDAQWVIAKFAYGAGDADVEDEQVDIHLLRDCGTSWEFLGSTVTTSGQHATTEGVADTGGRIYFEIPSGQALGLGRHRLHLILRGDLTTTDLFIEVLPEGAPLFVSGVDGTLTTTETTDFTSLVASLPDANPDAAAALQALVVKGYHPMYLTARPEWLVAQTREFLRLNGFPDGIVHTTVTMTGAVGQAATDYKSAELAVLASKGLEVAWAIGNTASDAAAYENGGIQPLDHRLFFQFTDSVYGGRRFESYAELLGEVSLLPGLCE